MSFTADVSFLPVVLTIGYIACVIVSMSFTADVSFLPSPSFFPLFMLLSRPVFSDIYQTISHMRKLISLFGALALFLLIIEIENINLYLAKIT